MYGQVSERGRLRLVAERLVPRLLFWLSCAVSAALVGLVLLAPLLVRQPALAASAPWLTLFADDAAVRRTAVASALGLLVTACVFFRPLPANALRRQRSGPPSQAVGA